MPAKLRVIYKGLIMDNNIERYTRYIKRYFLVLFVGLIVTLSGADSAQGKGEEKGGDGAGIFNLKTGDILSPGKLTQPHSHLEGITNCTKCHLLNGGVPDKKCLACHSVLKEKIDLKTGYHSIGDIAKKRCIICHTDHKGSAFDILALDEKTFPHEKTGYRLEGKHRDVRCEKCHSPEYQKTKAEKRTYIGLRDDCLNCHKDIHQGQLSRTCEGCHNLASWKGRDINFIHNRDSKYSLTGRHKDIDCFKCHPTENRVVKYVGMKFQSCIDCHKDKHAGTMGTPLKTLGKKCEGCHNTETWRPLKGFWKELKVEHSKTRYILEGKHEAVACEKCHLNDRLKWLDFSKCISCHTDEHKKQFVQNRCDDCHNVGAWKPSTYDHEKSEYKLKGVHLLLECAQCHTNGRYKPLESKCQTCHPLYGDFFDKLKTLKDPLPHPPELMPKDVKCEECHGIGFKHEVFREVERGCDLCHPDLYSEWQGYWREEIRNRLLKLNGDMETLEKGLKLVKINKGSFFVRSSSLFKEVSDAGNFAKRVSTLIREEKTLERRVILNLLNRAEEQIKEALKGLDKLQKPQ
ncbi:MAG: hypothetical protein A2073_05180 [Deltaproteobacteria bacterium GWC2_42_11]|nr:MAG: hypothetical protein A2073_05180 [Deltaproteobacteria bacterium GWC2_42_11]HBO84867.1 hypothetical protein [Deltaproteobacteria bacterium]